MTPTPILDTLKAKLADRFGGKLLSGAHDEDGECCVLELASVVRGVKWTDEPRDVQLPDLRGLNDTFREDALRTEHVLPVLASLWNWPNWANREREEWYEACLLRMAREVIAPLDPERPWATVASLNDVRKCARDLDLDLDLDLALDLARARAIDLARALALDLASEKRDEILIATCAIYRQEADRIQGKP